MKPYSVSITGIPEYELVIFKLIFSVSGKIKSRTNSFTFAGDSDETADIVITAAQLDGTRPKVPARLAHLTIADQAPGDKLDTVLLRPLITTRVLSTLDRALAAVLEDNNDDAADTAENHNQCDITPEAGSTADTVVPLLVNDLDTLGTTINADNQYHSDTTPEAAATADTAVPLLENEFDSADVAPNAQHNSDMTPEAAATPEVEAVSMQDDSDFVDADLDMEPFDFSITEEEASELAIVHDDSLSNPANLQGDIFTADVTKGLDVSHEPEVTTEEQPALSATASSNGMEYGQCEEKSETTNEAIPASASKALVVDDSPSVRKQLELELDLFDVEVDYAESAEQAMLLLDKSRYNVAFLDVVLPDKDGFSICKHIKNENIDTTVIMLTGKSSPAYKVKGTLAGCDAYLVKPVGRSMFQNTVKSYLNALESAEVMQA